LSMLEVIISHQNGENESMRKEHVQ